MALRIRVPDPPAAPLARFGTLAISFFRLALVGLGNG